MSLKAKAPEKVEKRLKLFVFGPSGVGKTTAAIQFGKAVIIDTERGSDFYTETILKSGSVVLKSNNFDEVKNEIKELLTTKHEYRTLIIDPITQLYNSCQEKWNKVFEKHAKSEKDAEVQDWGVRYWGRVKSDFKSLQRLIIALDMNVIITSHQKDLYGPNMTKLGVTFDSIKGEDYLYDFVFKLENKNGKRTAITIKERAEIGKQRFPEEFEWSYDNFKKFYGAEIIEKESIPLLLATQNQIDRINQLLDVVKVDSSVIESWFTKANVESWSEMPAEYISKCISAVEKKLPVTDQGVK